ncbi:hypothetical protein GCM10020001_070550 [Nonomuraea salmonea]
MELGRVATVLSRFGGEGEVVDVFGPAEASQVASVEEQRVAIHRFFGSPVTGGRDWSSVPTG